MATKPRGTETVRDMLLSLAVILVAVLLFTLLRPRHTHTDPVREVDYGPAAFLVAQRASYPVQAPNPLPAGWQANYARTSVDPAPELHVGFVKDKKRFAQLDETSKPDAAFLAAAKVPAQPDGAVSAGGQNYEIRRGSDGLIALVRPIQGGLVTLSNDGGKGAATLDELVQLAGSLRPVVRS